MHAFVLRVAISDSDFQIKHQSRQMIHVLIRDISIWIKFFKVFHTLTKFKPIRTSGGVFVTPQGYFYLFTFYLEREVFTENLSIPQIKTSLLAAEFLWGNYI